MTRRWSAHERKRAYASMTEAEAAIDRMKRIYDVDIGHPYLCAYENHWHTGHRYKGDRYLDATTDE